MLSLTDRLRARIQSEGPISFHDWMTAALYDPAQGYYCRDRKPWGRAGDYWTSAERSSLFSAAFARYFANLYQELGSPAQWSIIELGAGSGVFASGVLESLALRFPLVDRATRYVIDEIGPHSQLEGQRQPEPSASKVTFTSLSQLEKVPVGIVFSNEFLDSFPVHRVTQRDGELRELFVAINEKEEFEWETGELSSPALIRHFADAGISLVEGQIAEVNLQLSDWAKLIAAKLERGFVITVDYGAQASELYSPTLRPEGTLRGFRNHQFTANVLETPGEQDLTSTVDWSHVMHVGELAGLQTISLERQDQFLLKAGILEELEQRVNETKEESEKVRLRTSAREMIMPDGMSASFQVLVQEKS